MAIDFLRNQSVVEVGLVHRHPSSPAEGLASSPAEGLAEGRLSGHPDYFGIVRETENAFVARVSAPSERGDTNNNNKENEDTRKAIRRGIRSLSPSLFERPQKEEAKGVNKSRTQIKRTRGGGGR